MTAARRTSVIMFCQKAVLLACWLLGAGTLQAQLPATRLDGLFPAGAAPKSTVEVTIAGTDLDDVDRLLFSHPGFKSERKMAPVTPFDEGPQPVDNVFLITLDAIPPGNYEVRCQGKYGLSNPRTFVVSALPEIIEVEPNGTNGLPEWKEVDDGAGGKKRVNLATEVTLPAMVNGQSQGGADVDWYRFQGNAGQRLLVDGFARRIDSRMDLVLALFDSAGRLMTENRAYQSGDPLLDVVLPAAGEYFLKVHDALYQQGPGYTYRLQVGEVPHIDFIFPPSGLPGSNDEYAVYGRNLPGGEQSEYSIDGKPLQRMRTRIAIPGDVANRLELSSRLDPHLGGMDGIEYRIGSGPLQSNPMLLTAASAPLVLEQLDNNSPAKSQQLSLPCEVAGQFYPRRDADWFQFDAKQGEIWSIEVYSQRLNVPTDPALLLQRVTRNEAGEEQVADVVFLDDNPDQNFNNMAGRHEFDMRTTDPAYMFTVPADGTYRIMLKDSFSSVKTDPRLVYRLAIRKPAPDFRIVAVPGDSTGSLMLRKGGRDVVRIFVDRRDGYDGEVRINATGLPGGVTTEEIVIGPANKMGTLVLSVADNAPPAVGTLDVSAKAIVDGKEVTRPARYGAALMPFQFNQPNANIPSVPGRIVNRIQVCVSEAEPAPQLITIGEGKALETSRGGVLKIPYKMKQVEGSGGNLIGFPIDFPPQTSAQQVNIGGNASGEFEMRFQSNTPPGTYTFYLAGFNQGLQYRRNPEAAAKAKERQERIGKILTDAQQATQQAQQLVQTRQNELNQANAALNQANSQKQQTEQAAAAAETALKQAEEALKQKQDQSAANPADEALKTQVTQATTARDEATKKLKEAQTTAADALKKQMEATTAQTAATEAKTKSDQEFQQAQQFQQQAQQEKQRADQVANQKQNEANPRSFNVNVPSNSLTLKITEFPIKVEALPETVPLKQGEKTEVAVKVSRLYDFTTGINVQTQLPGGVGGVGIQNVTIPDNQTDGKFEMNAAANATVGEHACTVRLQMNFNGQNLVLERPLKLQIIEVKPPQ